MKALTLIFVVLIALLQYPLWLGKGSWLRVWDLSHQISKQQEKNNALKARNDTLDAEVRDLKSGRAAIEERARSELGMVKQDEVFYQVLEGPMPVIVPPPIASEAAKTDTPIVVKVPSKNSTTNPATKATVPKVSAGAKNKSTKPIPASGLSAPGLPISNLPASGLPAEKASQEKQPSEKSSPNQPLTQQPINPSSQIDPVSPKKTVEKTKEEKPKKVKPDGLDAAKSVLKQ